jgi:putative membrane protein
MATPGIGNVPAPSRHDGCPHRLTGDLLAPTTMLLESLLAYAHFLAILTMVVFIASEAALCRPEWLNAAVVRRLARVDLIYGIAAVVVLLTGLARTLWGIKGMGWYWHQPLLHIKVTLFVLVGVLSIKPTFTFLRWRREVDAGGALPGPDEVRATRRLIMIEAHLLALIPLAAALLARGVWTR